MLQNMVFRIFDALWRMQGYDKKHGKDEDWEKYGHRREEFAKSSIYNRREFDIRIDVVLVIFTEYNPLNI